MTFVTTMIITLVFCPMCGIFCRELQAIGGPRIVGGDKCDYDKYLYAVSIYSTILCGGSIVALSWVLTAAHCIKPYSIKRKNTWIRAGFTYGDKYAQKRLAIKGIPHKKFNLEEMSRTDSPELRYDIGMILVDKPFTQTPYLSLAVLPKPGFSSECVQGTALGVGYRHVWDNSIEHLPTTEPSEKSLMCVDLNITDTETCSKTWPDSTIDDTILCTLEEGGKDACLGDSGGPFVCRGKVIGIISAGRGCALPGKAATYTKVEPYLDFINETMISNFSCRECGSYVVWVIAFLVLLGNRWWLFFFLSNSVN